MNDFNFRNWLKPMTHIRPSQGLRASILAKARHEKLSAEQNGFGLIPLQQALAMSLVILGILSVQFLSIGTDSDDYYSELYPISSIL